MAKDLRILDLPIEIVERLAAQVCRWRTQSEAVENSPQSLRRHPEIVHRAEELDVLVTDLCDVGERALEITPRVVAQSVKLNPHSTETTRCSRHATGSRRAGQLLRGDREAES